jgi:hypothetical protein
MTDFFADDTVVNEDDNKEEDANSIHALYNSTTGYTNQQALTHGYDAAQQLNMTANDVICISVTFVSCLWHGQCRMFRPVMRCHDCFARHWRHSRLWHSIATRGRHAASVGVVGTVYAAICRYLHAPGTTHHHQLLLPRLCSILRGGACKIGSGDTFLDETVEYAGVQLRTVGKKKQRQPLPAHT